MIARAAIALAGALLIVSACEPRARRDDWRHPGRARPCSADADCPGGKCVLEIGAESGACGPAENLPQLPGADGGAGRPNAPPPSAQPGPNDIHI
ncbi:MAG: hypothetical protein KF819_05740 [Labilithrix sp.]|nr:hypothetical protein [Labilithrix sp.]